MAYSYRWSELVAQTLPFTKGAQVGLSDGGLMACDFVSSRMAAAYPWKEQTQTIATATLPLVDGVQDYDVPINFFRLLRARITRTDIAPPYLRELNVVESNAPDLTPRSLYAINSISHESGVGRLRLECAVQIPSGVTAEIQGEYNINPAKVTNLSQQIWFDDKYAEVAQEGLLYYFYKMENSDKAGGVATDSLGHTQYTGQAAAFHAALWKMRVSEGFTEDEQMFPSEPLGISRDTWYPQMFGV
jgi:hypothetical protein